MELCLSLHAIKLYISGVLGSYLLQNAIDKEYCSLSLEKKMETILKNNLLKSATHTLGHSAEATQHTISIDMLESVARMRYALQVVAELLQLRVSEQGQSQPLYGIAAHRLLDEARFVSSFYIQAIVYFWF